jgi:hemerythrin-like domain-containing protein
METICDYLSLVHKRCDDFFNNAMNCVAQHQWEEASRHFNIFYDAAVQHIRMEEKILFPAFAQAMPDGTGPIAMLRIEHQQICGIADRMYAALQCADQADFVLHAETYDLLTQQHTVKEEGMLFPLLDKILADKRNEIISAMSEFLEHDHASG